MVLLAFIEDSLRNLVILMHHETIKKEKQPFRWTSEAEKKFQLLKKKITKKPILALPDFSKPFEVKCNANGEVIGGVSSQEDRPIDYFSEK